MIHRTKRPRPISAKQEARRRASGEKFISSSIAASSRKPLRKVNPKRKASEFARCFHSRARVRFVKALPCVYCAGLSPFIAAVAGPSDNAHTVKEGMGRRGHYSTIVPLCRSHHRRYDERLKPFDAAEVREAIASCAPRIEAAWQKYAERAA